MREQTITIHETPQLQLTTVPGDLRVAGWERPELVARTSGETLELHVEEGRVQITCDESLILYVPRRAVLHADSVNGDVSLQALSDRLTIGQIGGDLALRDVSGEITIEAVAGDCSARLTGSLSLDQVAGDLMAQGLRGHLTVRFVGGDVSLRAIEGNVVLEDIAGDLYVRNVRGSLRAGIHGDAALYLQPQAGAEYRVTSDGDLLLRLPHDTSARLHLTVPEAEALHIDFPGVTPEKDQTSHELTIGQPSPDMPAIFLSAGGDLVVTSQAERWDAIADFGVGMHDHMGPIPVPPIPPIPPVPPILPDLSQRLRERAQAASERARRKVEAANRRMEIKIEAATRRAEARARRAGLHVAPGQVKMNIDPWEWDLTPRNAGKQGTPPSDEERLAILRMLQEKKISPEEAEKLLDALEGR